jgi:hypothetical protein
LLAVGGCVGFLRLRNGGGGGCPCFRRGGGRGGWGRAGGDGWGTGVQRFEGEENLEAYQFMRG